MSGDKNVLILVQGGCFSHGKGYDLLLGGRKEVREPCLHLLFLKRLQLKITNMTKWGDT